MINLYEVITDGSILANRVVFREGFAFTAITHPGNVYDAIIIKPSEKVNGLRKKRLKNEKQSALFQESVEIGQRRSGYAEE